MEEKQPPTIFSMLQFQALETHFSFSSLSPESQESILMDATWVWNVYLDQSSKAKGCNTTALLVPL